MRLKKVLAVALSAAACLGLLTGCGGGNDKSSEDSKKLVVGASPSPHADILKAAQKELKKEGYTLEKKS